MSEKNLKISLFGKDGITIAAFKNKEKTKPTDPDFKGNGITVWVNERKDNRKQEEELVL